MGEDRLARGLARWRVRLGFLTAALTLLLARPTWRTWIAGLLVAFVGECIRVWAAGHLEKGREVTRSGPYRFVRHPLYVGSVVIAAGVALAARDVVVALAVASYMGLTIAAAVRTEEAQLRDAFGSTYDDYRAAQLRDAFGSTYDDYRAARAAPMPRRFSVRRALRNREHRATAGLLAGFALLALKVAAGS